MKKLAMIVLGLTCLSISSQPYKTPTKDTTALKQYKETGSLLAYCKFINSWKSPIDSTRPKK